MNHPEPPNRDLELQVSLNQSSTPGPEVRIASKAQRILQERQRGTGFRTRHSGKSLQEHLRASRKHAKGLSLSLAGEYRLEPIASRLATEAPHLNSAPLRSW
jgi:hypothetical protein